MSSPSSSNASMAEAKIESQHPDVAGPSQACDNAGDLQPKLSFDHLIRLLDRARIVSADAIRAARPVGWSNPDHAALTAIFFSAFCASALFGNVTFRTPFLKVASILS